MPLFILLCNLMGLIPGLVVHHREGHGPARNGAFCALSITTTGAFAQNGLLGHAKHFMGPIRWMSPLMVLIEIISHLARLLSLTARLYANMFAGEMVTLVFFFVPLAFPVLFLGLHFGVALIQAYIFMLLTMIYIGEAAGQEQH